MNFPYFPQRIDVIPSAITVNSSLDYANVYHNRMNSVLQNKATLFPQISVIDDVVVTNQSNQSGKWCAAQHQGNCLTPNIVAGNENVQYRIVYHRINHIS